MQTFFDVSRRRAKEARALLDVSKRKRACDGAATCALLAAECALKAALLYGRQADKLEDVEDVVRSRAFESKLGHDLAALWDLQDESIKQKGTGEQAAALSELHRQDRYEHRYGLKRPDRPSAEKVVEFAEEIVQWMEKVVV
jgi:HEPN domain-containing protein